MPFPVRLTAGRVAGEAGQVDKAGEFAAEYFIRNRSNEPESYRHSDENRLVMRDWMGIEIPW